MGANIQLDDDPIREEADAFNIWLFLPPAINDEYADVYVEFEDSIVLQHPPNITESLAL